MHKYLPLILLPFIVGCGDDPKPPPPVASAAATGTVELSTMTTETLLYSIYEKPKDYPDGFVVRKWRVEGPIDNVQMIDQGIVGKSATLEGARELVPDGWMNLGAFQDLGEDSAIKESWTPQPKE